MRWTVPVGTVEGQIVVYTLLFVGRRVGFTVVQEVVEVEAIVVVVVVVVVVVIVVEVDM